MHATKLRMAARWAVVFGSGILIPLAMLGSGGCHSNPDLPMMTGNHGGLLPGQILPDPGLTGPMGVVGETHDERLPDGGTLRTNIMLGALYAREWFSTANRPVRAIYYENNQPAAEEDYDATGQLAHVTKWFPGTGQVQRVEDYKEGKIVVRYATYWPNGKSRVVSESGLVASDGQLINRVRQYYESGVEKSLAQHITVSQGGDVTFEMMQGRQTEWDEKGFVVADAEYDHDVLTINYLAKKIQPDQ